MRDMRSFFGRGIEDTIFLALFASHYDQLLFSRSLRACSTELLPLVRSSRQRALALSNGCRQPLVHRASMLLATSSQTPAESRSSCLVKLSTRGCLRSFVTSTRTSCCGIDLDQMSARYLSVYFHNVQERVDGFSCAAANRLFVGGDKEGPGELGGVARLACEEASVRLSGTGNLVLS